MLHLFQDMAWGDDQDPVAPTPANQLGQDHPDFHRLTQTNRVGQQNPRPEIVRVEGPTNRCPLVIKLIDESTGARLERVIVDRERRLTDRGLQPQPALAIPGRVVGDHLRGGWIEDHDLVEVLVKHGLAVPDQFGQSLDGDQRPVGRLLDPGDQPLLVANDYY